MTKKLFWILLAWFSVVSANARAEVRLTPVLTAQSLLAQITNAGDGTRRLFTVHRSGFIKVLQPGGAAPTTFLDISAKVVMTNEQGLRSVAFHPEFAQNRRFFVNYTRKSDYATVIAEYAASESDPDFADTSERILLVIRNPVTTSLGTRWTQISTHGGMLAFGPDGCLYISTGDEGSKRTQVLSDLRGKILRIDVDSGTLPYGIPADNPFAGEIAGRDEIYALGFASPRRFSFDRVSGALWVGDVAQAQAGWQEIDLVTRGGNYGWPVLDGTHCTTFMPSDCGDAQFVPPLIEYNNPNTFPANFNYGWVTGGYAYRGKTGTFAQGAYIFADFLSGQIYQWLNGHKILLLDLAENIVSFGEDEDGEIYLTTYDGDVFRFVGAGLDVTAARLTEGNNTHSAAIAVNLNPVSKTPVTLNYALESGTAIAGSDFVAQSGALTFAPGEGQKLISVSILGNAIVEPDEIFVVRLSNVRGASVAKSSGVQLIVNDDGTNSPPVIQFYGIPTPGLFYAPGVARNFVSTCSDENGADDIETVHLHVGATLRPINALRFRYDCVANKFYILDDAGKKWLGGFAPGSANVISNSQGSLDCSKSSISKSGNTLNVTWRIIPGQALNRSHVFLWQLARDRAGQVADFKPNAAWTISDGGPTNIDLLGNAVSVAGQRNRRTIRAYTPTKGTLAYVYFHVGPDLKGTTGLRCLYDGQKNLFYLRNDDDTKWLGGFAPGSANIISNSRGSLDCKYSATGLGSTTSTVAFALTANAAWTNTTQKIYSLVKDTSGRSDGWDEMGTWSIVPDGKPTNLEVKTMPGTGYWQTTHFDPNGWQDIRFVQILFGTTAANGFLCRYDATSGEFSVRSDDDTTWNTLPTQNNSRAFLTDASVSGDSLTLTITWAIGVNSIWHGTSQPIFVHTRDSQQLTSGWTPFGHWNIYPPQQIF